MSYRTLKRLLGETSLERKCRYLFGGGLLLLITGSFLWYGRQTEKLVYEQNRDTGRLLVAPIMVKHHWNLLDDPRLKPSIDRMFDELKPAGLQQYRWSIIKPKTDDPDYLPNGVWEYEAVERLMRGEVQEVVRLVPEKSEYQYLAPVRATESCVTCHRESLIADPRPDLKEGDVMAVANIKFPTGPTQSALNKNRAILFSTAMVTVFLAMAAAYVIVRYVIVKPVQHLREVSDAISRGNLNMRSQIQTGDEFEELSHAFNRMLRHLVAVQEELRHVNSDLDAKVDELAQANMALYEMNRLKSDFLATMSHELRTPLNSILGFSDVLLSNEKLRQKQRRYITHIQSSGKMLLGIINDILDLAKIESGKMELHLAEFSLPDLIEKLLGMAQPVAEQKNIDLVTDVAGDVPVMHQDPGKVQQILYNLISNAIKFTPEGGRVAVSARMTDEDHLLLSVSDTGVGISEEDQQTIFEKFRQGHVVRPGSDPMARSHPGTGLGLSIVKELSRLLGGEVTLQSELGKGSTFTVRLPVTVSERPALEVSLADQEIDLTKARRIDVRMVASSAHEEGE